MSSGKSLSGSVGGFSPPASIPMGGYAQQYAPYRPPEMSFGSYNPTMDMYGSMSRVMQPMPNYYSQFAIPGGYQSLPPANPSPQPYRPPVMNFQPFNAAPFQNFQPFSPAPVQNFQPFNPAPIQRFQPFDSSPFLDFQEPALAPPMLPPGSMRIPADVFSRSTVPPTQPSVQPAQPTTPPRALTPNEIRRRTEYERNNPDEFLQQYRDGRPRDSEPMIAIGETPKLPEHVLKNPPTPPTQPSVPQPQLGGQMFGRSDGLRELSLKEVLADRGFQMPQEPTGVFHTGFNSPYKDPVTGVSRIGSARAAANADLLSDFYSQNPEALEIAKQYNADPAKFVGPALPDSTPQQYRPVGKPIPQISQFSGPAPAPPIMAAPSTPMPILDNAKAAVTRPDPGFGGYDRNIRTLPFNPLGLVDIGGIL